MIIVNPGVWRVFEEFCSSLFWTRPNLTQPRTLFVILLRIIFDRLVFYGILTLFLFSEIHICFGYVPFSFWSFSEVFSLCTLSLSLFQQFFSFIWVRISVRVLPANGWYVCVSFLSENEFDRRKTFRIFHCFSLFVNLILIPNTIDSLIFFLDSIFYIFRKVFSFLLSFRNFSFFYAALLKIRIPFST